MSDGPRPVADPAGPPPPTLLDRLRRGRWRALAGGAALLLGAAAAFLFLRQPDAAQPAAPPRPPALPAPIRPDAAALLATLSASLPSDASLREVALDAGGRLALEVEAPDPERLRAALAERFPGLRTESEAAVPDRGYRVRLAGALPGRAPPGSALSEAALRDATGGLLVERLARRRDGGAELDLSGAEQPLLRLMGGLSFRRWRVKVDGGTLRLTGLASGQHAAAAMPSRTLFAIDDPLPERGGPELAGVVGRLPDGAVALVRLTDGRVRSVAPGGAADGWTLAALSADAALFTRGGERLRVAVTGGEGP